MDKITIKLNTVEDGDLEMISMIAKLLEDYFYNFVSFDQIIEISKEESDFLIQIFNEFGDREKLGTISITSKEYVWKIRPYVFWDFEISETAYLENEDEEDFNLQLRSSFLKLLRKFVDQREEL